MLSAVFASLTLSCGNNTGIDIDIEVDMGRPNYKYDKTDCTGGINGQVDKATRNQCYEAVNVWAPDGTLIQRPGYVGISVLGGGSTSGLPTSATAKIIKEVVSTGTFTDHTAPTFDVGGLVVGDRIYIGTAGQYLGADLDMSTTLGFGLGTDITHNTNITYTGAEYFSSDGEWKPVLVTAYDYDDSNYSHFVKPLSFLSDPFTAYDNRYYDFIPGADWSKTTVNGNTLYFVRFTIKGAALSAGTKIYFGGDFYVGNDAKAYTKLAQAVQLSSRKVYVWVGTTDIVISPASIFRRTYGAIEDGDVPNVRCTYNWTNYDADRNYISLSYRNPHAAPASLAVIPTYDVIYAAYDNRIWEPALGDLDLTLAYYANPPYSGVPAAAAVETDELALASYSEVALLNEFPKANFIEYFNGVLWAANLEENRKQIRWSAVTSSLTPGYKIWPALNTEIITANDNSDITGIKGFGQNMVVFTNDSVWEMVFAGLGEATGLELYAPEKRVIGKGTVSFNSIQEVNGSLVFLAEDGIYAYNGTQSVRNLGLGRSTDESSEVERIKHLVKRISPSMRPYAAGVNWSTKHSYLLAVALDGAEHNNAVLVFDYENNTWWMWDNMEAEQWLLDEDGADNQVLYFVDRYGRKFLLDRSLEDHGAAIESYVVTRKMVQTSNTMRARAVEVESTNFSRSLDLEITANGAPFGASLGQTGTLDYTDAAEKEYNVAVYDVDSYTLSRDRVRDRGVLLTGKSFQVKITHDEKGTPFELGEIRVGAVPTGKR